MSNLRPFVCYIFKSHMQTKICENYVAFLSLLNNLQSIKMLITCISNVQPYTSKYHKGNWNINGKYTQL